MSLAGCVVGWVDGMFRPAASGRTWEEAMRAQLLAPLAMHQTTFTSSPVAEPRAVGHRLTPDGPVPVEPWTPRSHGPAGSTLLLTGGFDASGRPAVLYQMLWGLPRV